MAEGSFPVLLCLTLSNQPARSRPSDYFPTGTGSQLSSWQGCPVAGHPGTAQSQHEGLRTLPPLITFPAPDTT